MQLLPPIEAHFKLLQENFEKYLTAEQNATLDANSCILHPFTCGCVSTEAEDLFDLQSDFGMRTCIILRGTTY